MWESGCCRPRLLLVRVEEVIGRVRHKRLVAEACKRVTAFLRREPPGGVQPLDKGGLRQRVATGGSVCGRSRRDLEPGNGTLCDESGVGGGIAQIAWNSWIGRPHLAP